MGETGTRPIRVLHIVSGDLWGGAEAQVDFLIGEFAKGSEVLASALLFNAGRLADALSRKGIGVTIAPEAGRGILALVGDARAAIGEAKADLIHSHGYKETFVGWLGARGASPRPAHVRTQHSAPGPVVAGGGAKSSLYFALDAILARAAVDRMIAVSVDIERRLRAKLPSGRVRRIANGVEAPPIDAARAASARSALGAREGEVLVGAAGRLVPVKGFDILIDAVALLSPRERYRLVLFGDGPERAALAERAWRAGLGERVLLTGHVEEIAPALAALDILVLPSWHEGMPMTLLLGMALGLGIVASDVGGISEAVRDGESALLVAPGDAAAVARAVARLASDPALRGALGSRARSRAAADYGTAAMARETAALYREVLDAAPGRRAGSAGR